jgi:hypothetical protein
MRRFLALALVILGTSHPARADGWKAGTARVAITPDGPLWMAGYGARDHPSEGKLHDLWAKALVLDDGQGHRAALVTLDVCGISRPLSNEVRDQIEAKFGLDRSRVVLACSHTHSGPVVGTNLITMYPIDDAERARLAAYADALRDKLVALVGRAVESLAPATLSWSVGRCDFAVNRRENPEGEAPALRERLALKGPVDHDVPVLKVEAADGALRAVVFGYACHCTTLDGYEFSGDYAGDAQIALEAKHPGAQAMFWAGCGADANPIPRRSVELSRHYGAELAAAVERVLSHGLDPISGPLRTSYREIDLAFAEIPSREHWEALAKSDNRYEAGRAKALLARIESDGSLAPTYPYPVQCWRLGDGPTWIFLGGEVVVDFALRIQRNLGASDTWVAAYCNDVMAYIPSLRVLKEGGYEGGGAMLYYGQPAPWAEDVEERIIGAVAGVVKATQP